MNNLSTARFQLPEQYRMVGDPPSSLLPLLLKATVKKSGSFPPHSQWIPLQIWEAKRTPCTHTLPAAKGRQMCATVPKKEVLRLPPQSRKIWDPGHINLFRRLIVRLI